VDVRVDESWQDSSLRTVEDAAARRNIRGRRLDADDPTAVDEDCPRTDRDVRAVEDLPHSDRQQRPSAGVVATVSASRISYGRVITDELARNVVSAWATAGSTTVRGPGMDQKRWP
jgi:hypothetical protein